MPTIKNVSPFIHEICSSIKAINGVKSVYIYGSYAEHEHNPNYVIKDIDIISETQFDSGDLLAIDNSKDSALKIANKDLEDMGFCPEAVQFTKKLLSLDRYPLDHWVISSDKKLLHWGMIPDTLEEWKDLHSEAEKSASSTTGLNRSSLLKSSQQNRKSWKSSYDQYIARFIKGKAGWYPSEQSVESILIKARKI